MTPGATTLLLFLLSLCGSAAAQIISSTCRGDLTNGSNYRSNVDRLLHRRVFDEGRFSFFYNVTEGNPPDLVYGLFLCRPDVAADVCLSCIDKRSAEILKHCQGSKEAFAWVDDCLVRYSDRYIFSVMDSDTFINNVPSVEPSSSSSVAVTMLAGLVQNTTDLAIASDTRYATSHRPEQSSVEMNVWAQCTPDLLRPDCRNCLRLVTGRLTMSNQTNTSAYSYSPSCYVQYKISDSKTEAPSPSPAMNRTTDSNGGHRKTSIQNWVAAITIAGIWLTTILAGHDFWQS